MEVTFENDIKKINGRTLEEVLKNLESDDMFYEPLRSLFNKVNNLEGLKEELKELYKVQTPVFIMSLTGRLLGYKIPKVYDIVDDIL